MDRGNRQAIVHEVAKESYMTERLIETLSLSCSLGESQLCQRMRLCSICSRLSSSGSGHI